MDERDEDLKRRRFTRRALIWGAAQLGVGGALAARLHHLQLVEGETHQSAADENRRNSQLVAPARGEIFDRHGEIIAANRPSYRLSVIREQIKDAERLFSDLGELIEFAPEEIARIMRRLSRTPRFVPLEIRDHLDWETFSALNANAPALPGAALTVGWTRSYPQADPMAHVVGYVSAVNEQELARGRSREPLLALPGAMIGKNGVEKALDGLLRGAAGRRVVEINAGGRELRELDRDPGRPGAEVRLTIDSDLQAYATERLRGESGSAVVMDVRNGDVVAFASTPAYDPNKFVRGISRPDYAELRDNPYDPLRNKAAAGVYPPGSTFKMITAIAAIEAGVSPTHRVTCYGKIRYGGRDFHCWKRGGHGTLDMNGAIQQSCNVYFFDVARRAGIEAVTDVADRFGIGERFDLEMPNLAAGLLPTPAWSRAVRGLPWTGGETLNIGIGQGALGVSPLQLAVMTARMANGSERLAPRLIATIDGRPPVRPPNPPLGVSDRALRVALEGMNAVSNIPGGTAYRSRIWTNDMQIAGKTGTAQDRSISRAEREAGLRKNHELEWRLRDHALFVAFAPYDAPRYAIAVVVEHGGGGSRTAAPIARDIMLRALYEGEPPLEAYPPWVRPEIEAQRAAAADPAAAPPDAGGG